MLQESIQLKRPFSKDLWMFWIKPKISGTNFPRWRLNNQLFRVGYQRLSRFKIPSTKS